MGWNPYKIWYRKEKEEVLQRPINIIAYPPPVYYNRDVSHPDPDIRENGMVIISDGPSMIERMFGRGRQQSGGGVSSESSRVEHLSPTVLGTESFRNWYDPFRWMKAKTTQGLICSRCKEPLEAKQSLEISDPTTQSGISFVHNNESYGGCKPVERSVYRAPIRGR